MILKARDKYWDFVKGILIVLVVLGHMLMRTSSWHAIEWIYTFHMPLFVFISGLFSFPKGQNYIKGILLTTETYLVFLILYRLIDCRFNVSQLSIMDFIRPSFALWYLLSLLCWRLVVWQFYDSMHSNKWITLFLSLLIALLVGFIPIGTEFSLQRTFVFFPFFWCGFISKDYDIKKAIAKCPLILSLIGMIGLYVFFVLSKLPPANTVRFCGFYDYYSSLDFMVGNSFNVMIYRLICLIMGGVISWLFLRMMLALYSWGKIFIIKNTLFVYIYHVLANIILSIAIGYGFPNNTFSVALYSLCVVFLLNIIGEFSFAKSSLNPVSYFMKRFERSPKE